MDNYQSTTPEPAQQLNVDEFAAFIAQATGLKIVGQREDVQPQQQKQQQQQQRHNWRDGRSNATIIEYGAGFGIKSDNKHKESKFIKGNDVVNHGLTTASHNAGKSYPNNFNNTSHVAPNATGGLSGMFSSLMNDHPPMTGPVERLDHGRGFHHGDCQDGNEGSEYDAHSSMGNRRVDMRQVGPSGGRGDHGHFEGRGRDDRGNERFGGRGRGGCRCRCARLCGGTRRLPGGDRSAPRVGVRVRRVGK